MSNDTVSITTDMCFEDQPLEEAIADVARTFDVKASVEQLVGPAGGWPVVRLTGPRSNVRNALATAWEMDANDIAMYLD